MVIKALAPGFYKSGLAADVWKVFQYLGADFLSARMQDPANTNNVISDDLTLVERGGIKAAAIRALQSRTWTDIVV